MCNFDHTLDMSWIILLSGLLVTFLALRVGLDWNQVGPLLSYAVLLTVGRPAYAGWLLMTGFIIGKLFQSPHGTCDHPGRYRLGWTACTRLEIPSPVRWGRGLRLKEIPVGGVGMMCGSLTRQLFFNLSFG
jgi:hypothetical protein